MVLLWENANKGNSFAPQTISLDLSTYNYVGIMFELNTSNKYPTQIELFAKGISDYRTLFLTGGKMQARAIIGITDSGVQFGDNLRYDGYGGAGIVTDNANGVPIRIYGIKA